MNSRYIRFFDTEYDQREFLKSVNKENDYPLLLINRENNKVYFSSDGTFNEKLKYDNEEYLAFEKNNINIDFHIIPSDISKIEYSNNDGSITDDLEISKKYKKAYNKYPLYKVGLMSDVHYNDTDESDNIPDTYTDDGAEYSEDLINALNYFKNNNVDFVSCSGDITSDYRRHFRNYKLCVDTYGHGIPVYTSAGNHDTKPKDRARDEWKTVDSINDKYGIIRANDNEGTSFYFIKELENGNKDVFIYLNPTYGWYDNLPEDATEEDYSNTSYNTHNCRLLTQEELLVHNTVDEINDLHLYDPTTLVWLSNLLEEHKNDRCFIFTHFMLPDKAGNFHKNGISNNIEYYDYADVNKHADVLRGDQGEYIRNLMESYDNNLWFCGHSHYKWAWEKYDHNINITKTGNSYNIHLPSLSRPLPLDIFSYKNAPKDSEGALMEVYKDYVIIKGVVMKEGYNNSDIIKLIKDYPEKNMVYATPSMFTVINNQSSVVQLEDDYIQINYVFNSSIGSNNNNIYLNNNDIVNASNFGNYMPVLRFEDLQIWYGDSNEYDSDNDITYNILREKKVGFRDHTTSDDYYYYISSNHIYTLENYALEYSNGVVGIVFKTSGDSDYKNYKLHFRFKLKLGYVHIGYINKFLPIACFKLPTIKNNEGEA